MLYACCGREGGDLILAMTHRPMPQMCRLAWYNPSTPRVLFGSYTPTRIRVAYDVLK